MAVVAPVITAVNAELTSCPFLFPFPRFIVIPRDSPPKKRPAGTTKARPRAIPAGTESESEEFVEESDVESGELEASESDSRSSSSRSITRSALRKMQVEKDDMLITTKHGARSGRQVYINVTRLQEFIRAEGQSVENDPFIRYLGRIPAELFVSGAGIQRARDAAMRVQGNRGNGVESAANDGETGKPGGNQEGENRGNGEIENRGNQEGETQGGVQEGKNRGNMEIENRGNMETENHGNEELENRGNPEMNSGNMETENRGNEELENRGSPIMNGGNGETQPSPPNSPRWKFRGFEPGEVRVISFHSLQTLQAPLPAPAQRTEAFPAGESPSLAHALAKFEGILARRSDGDRSFHAIERFFAKLFADGRGSTFL